MRMKRYIAVATLALGILVVPAAGQPKSQVNSRTHKRAFGKTGDGKQVDLYVLTNKNGVEADVTNFGAAVDHHALREIAFSDGPA